MKQLAITAGRGLLVALVLTAVLAVSGCGSSRTPRATHLTAADVRLQRIVHTQRKAERAAQLQRRPSLPVCKLWRAELWSGQVPRGLVATSWKDLLRAQLRSECNKYLPEFRRWRGFG